MFKKVVQECLQQLYSKWPETVNSCPSWVNDKLQYVYTMEHYSTNKGVNYPHIQQPGSLDKHAEGRKASPPRLCAVWFHICSLIRTSFCYIAKWFSYIYMCKYILFHTLFHPGLLQDVEYSSLWKLFHEKITEMETRRWAARCQGKGGGRRDVSGTIKGKTRDPCGDGNAYLDLINVLILVMISL